MKLSMPWIDGHNLYANTFIFIRKITESELDFSSLFFLYLCCTFLEKWIIHFVEKSEFFFVLTDKFWYNRVSIRKDLISMFQLSSFT